MKIKRGETYADFIKRIRRKAKITQEEFGLRTGFCKASVCGWESGKCVPSFTSQRVIDDFAKTIK